MKWATPTEAKRWPEGSVVLQRSTYNSGVVRYYIREWFRPDWVNDIRGYGNSHKYTRFLLILKFKKK